jgi:hypothetical protein
MYQNKEIVIDIDSMGGVKALHMDEFPLSFLGRMKIGRASTIDFNPETQKFDINLKFATDRYVVTQRESYCPPMPEAALGFTGYDEARGYEVAWIQGCRKLGIDPLDREGVEIIQHLRTAGDSPQL